MQVKMSWIEHFMNWYPRHTKLYRRRSKKDPSDLMTLMKQEFDELEPFFTHMANTIWAKARETEREDFITLCQAILQTTTLEQAKAMARQAATKS